eukprot:jgi/Picsp_1/4287/NSC_01796-R1_dna a subunit
MADAIFQLRMAGLRNRISKSYNKWPRIYVGKRWSDPFFLGHPCIQDFAKSGFSTMPPNGGQARGSALSDDTDARIIETELRREAEQSYLSYAMSVIVGRALPDVRDGLKPVHRRILFAMEDLGLQPNKPFRKCARVVGEVLGKYHPHGDSAVYDALVRMVQDFSMRIPLVDGHGNFGSLDDDPAAAMRYTECRLQPFTSASLLSDLDSDTIQMLPNFDGSVMEPSVLPARVPNLLINGSQGIAVGIATRIPPHNIREVMMGVQEVLKNPQVTVRELMEFIPGPDFPTGGEILKSEGLYDAYSQGKGSVLVRAKMHIEETSKKRTSIVITELPYQTNKASLVEQIANLVDDGKISGISDIRDESDRSGMRVVIEIKIRGPTPELVMNQLQKHTSIQSRFSCNMIALVDGLPKTLNLKDFLKEFITFREEVVTRRALFNKAKASKRLHLVEGYLIGIDNLDGVLAIVKGSKSNDSALMELQNSFSLSQEQAEGLLGMTLRRFTSFEKEKLISEKEDLQQQIIDIDTLLGSKEKIHETILREGMEIVEKYGSERRTQIVDNVQVELKEIDIIPNNPCILVFSSRGYIKRMGVNTFSVQGRRGTGKAGTRLKDRDTLEELIYAKDHDILLFFTREGHVHSLPAYSVPNASRTASGAPITQLIRVEKASHIAAVLPVTDSVTNTDVILLSEKGQIKRTSLSHFSSMSSRGLIAMKLRKGDSLKFAGLCQENQDVLLTSTEGFALRFPVHSCPKLSAAAIGCKVNESDMRPHCHHLNLFELTRTLSQTMDIGQGAFVGMTILPAGSEEEIQTSEQDINMECSVDTALVLVTKKGMGKRVPIPQIRTNKTRTGKGIKIIKLKEEDALADAVVISDVSKWETNDAVISTANGMVVRFPLDQLPIYTSRITQGNHLVRIREGDSVSGITIIQE